ncbi:MAG: Type 1 glutamine amidotransferase-like domain-containing protein [Pseudomonadales bacterium]|nr:Type 1 glutamine amidotransferase-like domain-containing protein [Pseudomonadales bacterium]
MTTFLLHGGATSKDLPENDRFFAKFTDLVEKDQVKTLLCYWSRNRDEWQKLIERDSAKIQKNTEKQVTFHVVEDESDLFSKIDKYDVLYVAGGDAELLEPHYESLGELKKKLDGKIYAGSSMGAFLASESYVLSFDSQDSDTKHQGVGLLPIQTLCHWDVEEQKEMKLSLLDSDKPIIVLNEGEFVEIYEK